jgi:tetratricopeptide (TPR) repeat protein
MDMVYLVGLDANRNNYPREAVAALSQYDPYDPLFKDWSPVYWGVFTTSYHMLGNYKQELKEARRGRKQFPDNLGMLNNEVDAHAALGHTTDLEKLFADITTLSGSSTGSAMLSAGRELRAHGFKEDSVRILTRALQWFDGRPVQEKASIGNRYNQARAFYVLEKWAEAKDLFEGLHKERPENINYLGFLGAIAARMGDRDGALAIAKQLEEDKRPYLFGNPAQYRARIAALLGDKEGAVNLLRQAIKEGSTYFSLHAVEDFDSLADYPPFVQFMKPKG